MQLRLISTAKYNAERVNSSKPLIFVSSLFLPTFVGSVLKSDPFIQRTGHAFALSTLPYFPYVLGGCYFPERWEGTWFQSGVRQPIIIEGPRLSSKGRCLGSEGDKFLVVDE